MSYTTIDKVAGMFPAFQRGAATQKPSDALLQTYTDDAAGEVDAVLQRRFAQAIAQAASFAAWVATLSLDAVNVLEKINRYGAAAQLGETLATFGVSGARDLARQFAAEYKELLSQLDARDDHGRPLPSGWYDHLFDALARTETPRPAFQAVAGGDQDPTQTPVDQGLSNVFGKFDKRGT